MNAFLQIGAASKGIIQRDFQHHATVFKSPYAKNPFDSVSNDELEEYKRIIDKKQRGETSPVIEDPGDTTDPGTFPSSSLRIFTAVINDPISLSFNDRYVMYINLQIVKLIMKILPLPIIYIFMK